MTTTRSTKTRGGAQFAPTRWTLVLAARVPNTPVATRALAELCELYWYPLYAYVRRRGYAPADAQDLTQGFFARLLEKQKLAGLTREKGKFRSFLLTALNNFLLDEWKKGQAQKRGAQQTISFDTTTAETRYGLEPADALTPERVFEKQWALTLLDTVFRRLQHEYVTAGKGRLFKELEFALTGARSSVPYDELSARLKLSESAVKVAVHRLRRRYREVLREEVAQTVNEPAEVEAELRDLLRAVAG